MLKMKFRQGEPSMTILVHRPPLNHPKTIQIRPHYNLSRMMEKT